MTNKLQTEKWNARVIVAQVFTVLFIGMRVIEAMPFDFGIGYLLYFFISLSADISIFIYLLPASRGHRFEKFLLPYGFAIHALIVLRMVITGMNSIFLIGFSEMGLYLSTIQLMNVLALVAQIGCLVGSLWSVQRVFMLRWCAFARSMISAVSLLIILLRNSDLYAPAGASQVNLLKLAVYVAAMLFYMGIFIYTLDSD